MEIEVRESSEATAITLLASSKVSAPRVAKMDLSQLTYSPRFQLLFYVPRVKRSLPLGRVLVGAPLS
jgi:hypothetical protein